MALAAHQSENGQEGARCAGAASAAMEGASAPPSMTSPGPEARGKVKETSTQSFRFLREEGPEGGGLSHRS